MSQRPRSCGSTTRRWTVVAVLAALLLSAAPSPVTAAYVWGEPVLVAAGPDVRPSHGVDHLVTFGTNGSIVAYTEVPDWPERHSYLSRTEDGITTAIPLGSGKGFTFHPSLAGRGDDIDVVWIRDGGRGDYVKYRHSPDAGLTWSETLNLTPVGEHIGGTFGTPPEVDRDGRGRVAAVWTNLESGRTRIRVSADGGETFRKAVTVARGYWPDVSLGGGVITVVYLRPCGCLPDGFEGEAGDLLFVRRSTDDGRTWSSETLLAEWAEFPDAYAVGKTVVVAYEKSQPNSREWVAVRRSLDGGKTWGPGVNLTSKLGSTDHFPVVWGRGNTWHTAFEKCLGTFGPESPCEEAELYYRFSTDHGLTWSPKELLPATPVTAAPIGVSATTTGPVVAWYEYPDEVNASKMLYVAAATEP